MASIKPSFGHVLAGIRRGIIPLDLDGSRNVHPTDVFFMMIVLGAIASAAGSVLAMVENKLLK